MSIIPQEATEKEVLFGRIQKFFSKHKIGALLKKCNGTKEKGVSAVSILKYKLCNIFVGPACICSSVPVRSMKTFQKILSIAS